MRVLRGMVGGVLHNGCGRLSRSFEGCGGRGLEGSSSAIFVSYAKGSAGLFCLGCRIDGWWWQGMCEVCTAEFLYFLWDGWVEFSS